GPGGAVVAHRGAAERGAGGGGGRGAGGGDGRRRHAGGGRGRANRVARPARRPGHTGRPDHGVAGRPGGPPADGGGGEGQDAGTVQLRGAGGGVRPAVRGADAPRLPA